MYNDLANYFYQTVVLAFQEYVEESNTRKHGMRKDLRKAIAAATALYHLREHLVAPHQLSWSQVVNLCSEYALLGDVVNTAKHRELRNPNLQITKAEQIEEQIIITLYEDSEGNYHSIDKAVILKLTDGSIRYLYEVLISVMNFWQIHLHEKGLISKFITYSDPGLTKPKSREECGSIKWDMELIAGLESKSQYSFQKYNYSVGRLEPLDISKDNFKMTIYKEIIPIDLSIKNPVTGEIFTKTINLDLNIEETEKLDALKTENEKKSYIANLPLIQKGLMDLAIEAGAQLKHNTTKQ